MSCFDDESGHAWSDTALIRDRTRFICDDMEHGKRETLFPSPFLENAL